ncbi:MAG: hypothetical protein AAFN07_13725 [Pseudomonadota bacterium]
MKNISCCVLAFVVASALSTNSWAQTETLDEIIVTGSRIGGYDSEAVPVVHIKRRPDFMVVDAFVESDSRDATRRSREINKVLDSLAKRAKSTPNISLGLSRSFETDNDEIEYVVDFDLDAVEIRGGSRVDTSRVTLVIKSPILESDTSPDEVYERIESFIDSIDVSGRAVVKDYGDVNYSLIGISQYREPLLKLIAEDAQRLREIFGENYQLSFSGLEEPVRWRISGAMQLSIYFPYSSSLVAN